VYDCILRMGRESRKVYKGWRLGDQEIKRCSQSRISNGTLRSRGSLLLTIALFLNVMMHWKDYNFIFA
jgi:hypothetical protein